MIKRRLDSLFEILLTAAWQSYAYESFSSQSMNWFHALSLFSLPLSPPFSSLSSIVSLRRGSFLFFSFSFHPSLGWNFFLLIQFREPRFSSRRIHRRWVQRRDAARNFERSRGKYHNGVVRALYRADDIDLQRHKTALPYIKFLLSRAEGNCLVGSSTSCLLPAMR